MKNVIFAAAAAGLAALIALAAPAAADGSDSTPIGPGSDSPSATGYRANGPQPQQNRSSFTGAPADQLPAASTGANPYVPLGPGH